MRAGKREKVAVAEKRRGYLTRESESKYFESVNARAEQKETKTVALKTRDGVSETVKEKGA